MERAVSRRIVLGLEGRCLGRVFAQAAAASEIVHAFGYAGDTTSGTVAGELIVESNFRRETAK